MKNSLVHEGFTISMTGREMTLIRTSHDEKVEWLCTTPPPPHGGLSLRRQTTCRVYTWTVCRNRCW
jgi:hypothetical protein